MSEIAEVAREWILSREFDPNELNFSDDGKQARFQYESSSGDGETYRAFLDLDIEDHWVELFVYAPSHVPQKRRRAVAELLAMLNERMHLGSFDLLMSDGRIRFRCGVDMEGGTLDLKMLDNMDGMASLHLNVNYPAIMATAYAGHSPERAFAEVTGEPLSDKPDPAWIPSEGEPPEWTAYPGTKCLQRWADELKLALSNASDGSAWELLGHGAIIEHDDMDRAQAMFRRLALHSGMKFVAVPVDAVLDLPLGVVDPFRSMTPVLVFLEPGEWMKPIKSENADSEVSERVSQFRRRLIERLNAFDSDHPVLFATACFNINDIDKDLRAVGVFERRFAVAQLPMQYIGEEFIDRIGRELCGETLTGAPGKVGRLVAENDSARVNELAAIAMKRLAHREARRLEFIDLVNFKTRGTIESDEAPLDVEAVRRQVAYHEAGHALVAILDSGGTDIPEYSTILASRGFKGVVVESYSYFSTLDAQWTYRNLLCDTRIALGGRAGEQILVGSENISSGASADLEAATRGAARAFAYDGFAPGMDDPANSGSNLAVVCDEPSPTETLHVEALVRQFLAEEYGKVLDMLNAHRPLLDAVAERLMWDPIVDQCELAALCAEHHIVFECASDETLVQE